MRDIELLVDRGEILDLKANTPEVMKSAHNLLNLVDEARNVIAELEGLEVAGH